MSAMITDQDDPFKERLKKLRAKRFESKKKRKERKESESRRNPV